MNKSYFLIIVTGLLHVSVLRAETNYQSFQKEELSAHLQFDYFKSTTNFNKDGQKSDLYSGNYFQIINIKPWLRWQFDEKRAVLAGFNMGVSESNDPVFTRTNSTLNQLNLSGEYQFLDKGWWRSYFRLGLNLALTKIDTSGDTVPNSDGAHEIIPEVVLNFDFENDFYTFIKSGLNYRTEGLSTLLLYGAGGEYRFESISVGAALLGKVTVRNDNETDSSFIRDQYSQAASAGSKTFYSINPNRLDLEGDLKFSFHPDVSLKTFMNYPLLGSNSAVGLGLGAILSWSLDSQTKKATKSAVVRPPVYAKPVEESPKPVFKEDINDGVDQNYFKPVRPEDQKYIKQIEGQKKSLENATTPDEESDDEGLQIKTKAKPVKGYKIKLRKKQ